MNKLEDFTEGSEWMPASGHKLNLHHVDESDGVVFFTCDDEHLYTEERDGTIAFMHMWKHFKRVK